MTDFYEDDEPVDDVLAEFDAAVEKGKTMPRSNPLADALAAIDKIPDRRAREVVLREFYQAYKDDPRLWDDPAKAEPVQPRRLGTVISVRLSSELSAELWRRAEALGVSLSDVLRHAADEFVRPTGWRCEHMTVSGRLESASCGFGCTMTPQYATA